MKTIITIVLFALSISFNIAASAQTQSETGTAQTTSDNSTTPLVIKVCNGKSVHEVPSIDANLVVVANEDISTIDEIEVLTGDYDVNYKPTVKKGRVASSNELARFTVNGHPNGSFELVFTSDDNSNTAVKGRQKNRRVEIKIIFN